METAKLLFPRAVTGKISKLPTDIREFINKSLDDGIAYDRIIAQLADKGYPGFNKNNLKPLASHRLSPVASPTRTQIPANITIPKRT